MKKINLVIHLLSNGTPCACCGETVDVFREYACNANTHGMAQYGHMDFQIVLALPDHEIARILNTLCLRVQAGERFKAGDMVSGIYEDCQIRLDEFEETDRKVLRVIIPDKYNIFPDDDRCMETYKLQMLTTKDLELKEETA